MRNALVSLLLAAALMAGTFSPVSALKGCGDFNKDLEVNAVDASLILQVSAGIYPGKVVLNPLDLDGDDMITSRDAFYVLQYNAGLLDELPDCYAI